MSMKYLLTIKVNTSTGRIHEGNMEVEIGILTAASLRLATDRYCIALRTQGVVCLNDDALVMAVIPLQA